MQRTNEDIFIKGIIDDLNFRFTFVKIKDTLQHIVHILQLSDDAANILGETLIGTFLLSTREAKDEDMIGVQVESEGEKGKIQKIYTFANSSGGIRGTILPEHSHWNEILQKGLIQVNKFKADRTKIYSSIIEIENSSLGKIFEKYLLKSHQVNAFLNIYSEYKQNKEIYGYFFEPLPDVQFSQIETIASFIYNWDMSFLKSLLTMKEDSKLYNHINKFFLKARILHVGFLYYYCDCSLEKIENLLFTLGKEEILEILNENSKVEITCEFCKKKYIFYQKDIDRIFENKNL